MRLERVQLKSVRKLDPGCLIDGLSPGLNLISGDNEEGKSSLLLALKCALFLSHGTTGQLRERLTPYGGGVPEVEIDFILGGERLTLVKPFKKDGTRLTIGNKTYQNAQAEEELERRLRFQRPGRAPREFSSEHLGMAGFFWVDQGLSFEPAMPGASQQERLTGLLAAEIGQAVAGEDGNRVLAYARERHALFWTPGGKLKTAGPLAEAQARLEKAQADCQEASDQLAALEDAFASLGRIKAEARRALEADEAGHLAEKLKDAQTKANEIQELCLEKRLKEQALETARQKLARCQQKRQARASAVQEIAKLSAEVETLIKDSTAITDAVKEADRKLQQLQALEAGAIASAVAADERLERARRQLERRELVEKLRSEEKKLLEARELQDRLEQARIAANSSPLTASLLGRINQAERDRRDAEIALQAASTRLVFSPDPGRRIWREGDEINPDAPLDLSESADLVLEGFGSLRVVPGGVELRQGRERLEDCQSKLAQALKAGSVASQDEAERAARSRQEAEVLAKQLAAERDRLLGGSSLDELSRSVAEIKAAMGKLSDEDEDIEEPIDDLRLALRKATEDSRDARAKSHAGSELYNEWRQKEAVARELLRERQDRLIQSQGELEAERQKINDQELEKDERLAHAHEHELQQEAAVLTAALSGRDEAVLRERITMHERALEALEKKTQDRRDRMRELEILISQSGGKGLGECHSAAKDRADAALEEAERLTQEAGAAKLLLECLEEESRKVRDRFTGPVRDRLRPLLQLVLPQAVPMIDAGRLTLDQIERSGQREKLEELSLGTREQLSVLIRLAFADLLVELEGEAPPIILDDALVYADETRLDTMKLILQNAAERHQIIILTCRPRDYIGLDAKAYELSRCLLPG